MGLLFWLVVAVVLSSHRPDAAAAETGERGAAASDPWHISADRIQYDQQLDRYEARGNVSLTRQGKELTADTVILDQKSQKADAQGKVRLISGKDVLNASRLQLNLVTETGELTEGSIFLHQNHLYLKGDHIRKTGLRSFSADKITLTTCDGSHPDWRITGKALKVTLEGYGFAKHAALWAGKVPVLYTPYLVFPAKRKRQSGLLMPELGYSDRKGGQYLQPFFWAINNSSDATFFAHHMTQRGTRAGFEYRYILSQEAFGTLMADGLQDRRVDDGEAHNSDRWGFEEEGTDLLRPNKDRYWLRLKQDQPLFAGLNAKLDIDWVSDQDYLHEFASGTGGFETSRDYYVNTFGRGVDDRDDPVRMNQLNISRAWNYFSFNTNMLWYDDVIVRRSDAMDRTLQQWPSISLNGINQPLADTPFRFNVNTSYIHFYRIYGTRGHRLDLYPRFYLPIELFKTLSVEPSVGFRYTGWRTYDEDPDLNLDGKDGDTFHRRLYDTKLDLNTELYRIYTAGLVDGDRIKHSLVPQIIYEFAPDVDQTDLPIFEASVDRIDRSNLITYGLTNLFTLRRTATQDRFSAEPRYITFLRFKLEQEFDINKQNEDDPEPFSPIKAELDLTPGQYVTIDSDAQWSAYSDGMVQFNSTIRLWNHRQDTLWIDYRSTKELANESGQITTQGVRSVRLGALVHVGPYWSINGAHERNLFDHNDIETSFGIGYRSQCWGMDLDIGIEENNQSFQIKFNLLGLGSVGN
jgi:LPS-assembly protein